MEYEDKYLKCKDCDGEFIFSAGEQAFYAEKGLTHEPVRCKPCRNRRKKNIEERNVSYPASRESYMATCSKCGKETRVPFKPVAGKSIYCKECLTKRDKRPAFNQRRPPAFQEYQIKN